MPYLNKLIPVLSLVWLVAACQENSNLAISSPSQTSYFKSDNTTADGGPAAIATNANSGITYMHINDPAPNDIYVASVDLTNPHVSVIGTRSEDRKKTVSDFAKQYRCRVAINTSFFAFQGYVPINITAGGGQIWPDTVDNASFNVLAAGLDNTVKILPVGHALPTTQPWMYTIASGFYDLVVEGKKVDHSACTDSLCARHPRTAAGLSQDGKTLFLVVVDGRRAGSRGMNFSELADLFLKLGAYTAINFDGGGSSAMWVGKQGGIVNHPSDKNERVVANHLGICDGLPADLEARKAIRPDYIPAPDVEIGLTAAGTDDPSGKPSYVP